MQQSPQKYSHFPAWPAPLEVPLNWSLPHPCSYLPQKSAEIRAISVGKMSPEIYHRFMDAGFRRSGTLIYQPTCPGCRSCQPLRVPVDRFTPTKSQRRCWQRNQDLSVCIDSPRVDQEKLELYRTYLHTWHGRADARQVALEELEEFLYKSPVKTIEFSYRDNKNTLIAVGICDVCSESLSSVYFYFDPAYSRRSLGTFGALREINYAKAMHLPFYYLGYYIYNCKSMSYKAGFRPYEVLGTDGIWRDAHPAGDAAE